MTTTEKIASFIAETDFDTTSAKENEVVKRVFLDCIGTTLAGYTHEMGKIITDFVKESGSSPRATVIGAGFKTSPADAALANGTMAHALDYDDYNLVLCGHPSVSLVPAILALGEERGISGKKALEAYIKGYEVEFKLGAALNLRHYELGWHATCTLGTMGAVAAAAVILELDVETTRIALGIAASEAGGLRQNFGTMTKPLHAGLSAKNGVTAALLAAKGFTADKNIFEAEYGFCNLFCGKEKYNIEALTDNLGNPYAVLEPGISIKPYPSCGGTHTALDGILDLVKTNNIKPDDVQQIKVGCSDLLPRVLIHSNPKSGLEGKFSMEYCMAIALLDKKAGLEQFTDEKAADPITVKTVKKVKIETRPLNDNKTDVFVEVTIKLNNGTELSTQVDTAKGNPDAPLSTEELTAKFKDCAILVLPENNADRIIAVMDDLENIQDIRELTQLLIP
ncbi:MAG TPA: hypothetical protein DD405_07535 [Desulfobacteraceae bacterium]|nr:hypothetical protein [Desulfobacteraceae bacterium]